MSISAPRDDNRVPTLVGTSSVDGVTPVVVWVNPTTHRVLADLPAGTGTVTNVAVATANGFAGSVNTATTTPSITISTTVTGLLRGNGTAVAASTVIVVSEGGTGSASFTPYSVILAPTVSTDPLITVSGVGTAGQVLTSNGAAKHPTWQPAGAGTVSIVGVVSANGLAGTVQNATTTPSITLSTSVNSPILAGNGTAILAATVTGSGTTAVLATSPFLTTPNIGAAIATTLNGLTVVTTTGTLNIASGGILATSGAFNTTITVTGNTGVTLPTSGTLYGTAASSISSAQLATSLSDESGTGNVVFTDSPVFTTVITTPSIITGTNTDLTLSPNGTGKIHHNQGSYGNITAYTPAASGTATLTLNTANIHSVAFPAGTITLAVSNGAVGQCFMVKLKQDSVGSRTVTWFSGISWVAGAAPTLTTTANKSDWIGFVTTASGAYDGIVVAQNI